MRIRLPSVRMSSAVSSLDDAREVLLGARVVVVPRRAEAAPREAAVGLPPQPHDREPAVVRRLGAARGRPCGRLHRRRGEHGDQDGRRAELDAIFLCHRCAASAVNRHPTPGGGRKAYSFAHEAQGPDRQLRDRRRRARRDGARQRAADTVVSRRGDRCREMDPYYPAADDVRVDVAVGPAQSEEREHRALQRIARRGAVPARNEHRDRRSRLPRRGAQGGRRAADESAVGVGHGPLRRRGRARLHARRGLARDEGRDATTRRR